MSENVLNPAAGDGIGFLQMTARNQKKKNVGIKILVHQSCLCAVSLRLVKFEDQGRNLNEESVSSLLRLPIGNYFFGSHVIFFFTVWIVLTQVT